MGLIGQMLDIINISGVRLFLIGDEMVYGYLNGKKQLEKIRNFY